MIIGITIYSHYLTNMDFELHKSYNLKFDPNIMKVMSIRTDDNIYIGWVALKFDMEKDVEKNEIIKLIKFKTITMKCTDASIHPRLYIDVIKSIREIKINDILNQ